MNSVTIKSCIMPFKGEVHMKVFVKLAAFALAVATVFAFSACKQDEQSKNDQHGWALDIETEEVKATEDGKNTKVLTIKGLYLGQGTQNDIDIDVSVALLKDKSLENLQNLVIGKTGLEYMFNVYDETKGDFQFDKDGKSALRDSFDNYDEIKIAKDAFSGQKIIKTVELTSKVTEIGTAAFAGCSNLTKMVLPFVGTNAKAYNVNKTFASLFGTAEITGCTSNSITYNEGGTGTYYIPSGLTDVIVGYATDSALPEYAFAGVTVIKNVTLKNVTEIGSNAFAGCTALTKVGFETAKKLETIYSSAFSGCTALYNIDLASLTGLKTVYQSAFSGCSKLGIGYETIVLPAATYMDKAFKDCTSLKSVDFANVISIGDACFYGCTGLEKVENLDNNKLASSYEMVFAGCTKLSDK